MSEPEVRCNLAAHEIDVDHGGILHPCPFCRIAELEAAGDAMAKDLSTSGAWSIEYDHVEAWRALRGGKAIAHPIAHAGQSEDQRQIQSALDIISKSDWLSRHNAKVILQAKAWHGVEIADALRARAEHADSPKVPLSSPGMELRRAADAIERGRLP